MSKTLGAFIAGFSLAMLIGCVFVYFYLSPFSGEIATAISVNETVYTQTHSEWYGTATSFLSVVGGVSGLPVVGGAGTIAAQISSFMSQIRAMSEKLRNTLAFLQVITTLSLPGMVIFTILFFVGLIMAGKPTQSIVIQQQPVKESSGKFCSKCGNDNEKNLKFCTSCGEKL